MAGEHESSLSTPSVDLVERTPKPKITNVADMAVNTPPYIDQAFQVVALTERCITLEKSLMEKIKNKNTNDFHTQILKRELSNYKLETQNLKAVIEALSNDKKHLEKEIEILKARDLRCLQCYPMLKKNSLTDHSWQTISPSRSHASQTYYVDDTIECRNQFELLANTTTETITNVTEEFKLMNKNPLKRKKHQTNTKTDFTEKNKINSNRPHLVILGDSHAKQIGNLIQQRTSADVCAFVRPGATFQKVTEDVKSLTKELSKQDYLLVIAGTNNMGSTRMEDLVDDIHRLIKETSHTQLLLATIPLRFDQPDLDLNVLRVNTEIEKIAKTNTEIKLLPLHLFPRHAFTVHGLHMNRHGKLRTARIVTGMLLGQTPPIPISKLRINTPRSAMPALTKGITVVEADMKDVIHHFRDDPSVALAHTISSDFYDNRHMSAGVAVVFGQTFGRPRYLDYIDDKLTFQKVLNGPSIYSLVTKDEYCGKPTKQAYDSAFHQLQQQVKKKNLKTLICSAMGCVRDLIEPQHFVNNIMKLHSETGVSVCVVTYPQTARRVLWRGLTHDKFVATLREKIDSYKKREEPELNLKEGRLNNLLTTPAKSRDVPSEVSSPSPPVTPSQLPSPTTHSPTSSTPSVMCLSQFSVSEVPKSVNIKENCSLENKCKRSNANDNPDF